MSSHWEWQKEVIAEHEKNKPFAPENGEPLKYKPGDEVIFTNEFGVKFALKVRELYKPVPIDSLYARGKRYLLASSGNLPVTEASLEPAPVVE